MASVQCKAGPENYPPIGVVSLCRPYCRFNIEHCVKKYHWIHYGTLNIFSFESRALSACCSGSPDFRRLWHPYSRSVH
ncbi:hypothetical protein C2C40_24160 [Escherichia coli]|nr:hypothetical protein [Escherichia coli]